MTGVSASNGSNGSSAESIGSYVARLQSAFVDALIDVAEPRGEMTLTVPVDSYYATVQSLRDDFSYESVLDVAGVDYLTYGQDEWETDVSSAGFSRGVQGKSAGRFKRGEMPNGATEQNLVEPRFAVVLHMMSVRDNLRLRVRTFATDNDLPVVPSVTPLYAGCNWFEREAFDMFGIIFEGHPDLRRILTDYGFVGHPFRKDFPLIGNVEVRYDESQRRVIYQPVTIEPRVGVPRVIRDDARFETAADESDARAHGSAPN